MSPRSALQAADRALYLCVVAQGLSDPRPDPPASRAITRAPRDVARGLSIQFDEPGLLELRGELKALGGQPEAAIDDFNRAMFFGALDRVHIHKASALVALGKIEAAVGEWSLALRRDPELPEAFLGRALAQMRLRRWDMALADLEQAAAWSHSDPRIELRIIAGLLAMPERPPRPLPPLAGPGPAHRQGRLERPGRAIAEEKRRRLMPGAGGGNLHETRECRSSPSPRGGRWPEGPDEGRPNHWPR